MPRCHIMPTLVLAIFAATTAAAAQKIPIPVPDPAFVPTSWPSKDLMTKGHSVKIVTFSAPAKRDRCNVVTFDAQQITCSRVFHRVPSVYRRQDVLAIIAPSQRGKFNGDFALCETIAGGVVTGAVFLGILAPSPLGILLAIPVGLLGVAAAGLCGLITDDGASSGYAPSRLLYIAPGQHLQVDLK